MPRDMRGAIADPAAVDFMARMPGNAFWPAARMLVLVLRADEPKPKHSAGRKDKNQRSQSDKDGQHERRVLSVADERDLQVGIAFTKK